MSEFQWTALVAWRGDRAHREIASQRRKVLSLPNDDPVHPVTPFSSPGPAGSVVQLGWFIRFRTHLLSNLID